LEYWTPWVKLLLPAEGFMAKEVCPGVDRTVRHLDLTCYFKYMPRRTVTTGVSLLFTGAGLLDNFDGSGTIFFSAAAHDNLLFERF